MDFKPFQARRKRIDEQIGLLDMSQRSFFGSLRFFKVGNNGVQNGLFLCFLYFFLRLQNPVIWLEMGKNTKLLEFIFKIGEKNFLMEKYGK